jgi:hypothetical protein
MGKEEWLDARRPHEPAKGARQVAIDENRMSVYAVTGDVGDVVIGLTTRTRWRMA